MKESQGPVQTVSHESREYETMGIGARHAAKDTEHHVYFHSDDGHLTMQPAHERRGVTFHTTIPRAALGAN